MQNKSKIIENGRLKVVEKSKELLNKSDLSKEQLIKIISQLMGNDYQNTKFDNYRWSVDNQIDLLKTIIDNSGHDV